MDLDKYIEDIEKQLELTKAAIEAIKLQRHREKQLKVVLEEIGKIDPIAQQGILDRLRALNDE